MAMFKRIYLHNFSRPLRERAESRKCCGPYQWTPVQQQPGQGRGFYLHSKRYEMGDGPLQLRIRPANDALPSHYRLAQITGYYTDDFHDGTLQPLVARLSRGRGFLAGWTMGHGMSSCVDGHIYGDEVSAAIVAHSMAERDAETE